MVDCLYICTHIHVWTDYITGNRTQLKFEVSFTSVAGTCCIADLSLAVKNDGNLASELLNQPWGSPRYLAPEFLAEYGGSQWDIDKLRRGDMYSYGLVLWELARRCAVQGK